MPDFPLTRIASTARLLKQLIDRSDANMDGALRRGEINGALTPKTISPSDKRVRIPALTLRSLQNFAQIKGSVQVTAVKAAVDEAVRRIRAADKDHDGILTEAEQRALRSGAEGGFVSFGLEFGKLHLKDFNLPPQHRGQLPPFRWSGTPEKVCTSLLNAFSERKNDNYWSGQGPSRYVITTGEAKKMVAALQPLYPSRQKAVLAELSKRTQSSFFGCVACTTGAQKVLTAYAAKLGTSGLTFLAPRAPSEPSP